MSSVQIIQIKCPNCGSQLNSVAEFSQMRTCSYCNTEFHVTGTMSKELETPERIVPFVSSKENFESQVLGYLANEDLAPDNIFDMTSFDAVEGVYLPMFLYEGKYECSWNCSVGYEETEMRTGSDLQGNTTIKNKKVIKYRPMNGANKGNYAFVCMAYEGKEVKPELADYARTFDYEATLARDFDSKMLEHYNFLLHNKDKEATWSKWGAQTVKGVAEEDSLRSVPGDTFKDFRASVSIDAKHDGRLVFIPFWAIYYNYDNEQHFVLMEGTGRKGVYGSTPIDKERQKKFELWRNIPKWTKIASYIMGPLLWFVASFGVGLSVFLVLFLGAFVLGAVGKLIIKKTVAESRKVRNEKLQAILKGGN